MDQGSAVRVSRNWESMQLPIDAVGIMTIANITSFPSLGSIISSTTGFILSVIADVMKGMYTSYCLLLLHFLLKVSSLRGKERRGQGRK